MTTSKKAEALVEGVDFYYDRSGLMVLTRRHLLERGHCCESGCRHCPYGFGPGEPDPTEAG